jgi:hypothetical protein
MEVRKLRTEDALAPLAVLEGVCSRSRHIASGEIRACSKRDQGRHLGGAGGRDTSKHQSSHTQRLQASGAASQTPLEPRRGSDFAFVPAACPPWRRSILPCPLPASAPVPPQSVRGARRSRSRTASRERITTDTNVGGQGGFQMLMAQEVVAGSWQ